MQKMKVGYSFGQRITKSNFNAKWGVPGPGAYQVPKQIHKRDSSFSKEKRFTQMHKTKNPGPGDQSISDSISNCSFSIPRAQRGMKQLENNAKIGPGSQNLRKFTEKREKKEKNIQNFFGSSRKIVQERLGPGPGTQNNGSYSSRIRGTFQQKSPSCEKTINSSRSPGPADYNIPSIQEKIQKRVTKKIINENMSKIITNPSVGPGAQNIQHSGDYYYSKPSSYSFSKNQKKTLRDMENARGPGPGSQNTAWNIQSKGPKILARNWPDWSKLYKTPGPAEQTVVKPVKPLMQWLDERSTKEKLPKKQAKALNKNIYWLVKQSNNVVGPGQYSLEDSRKPRKSIAFPREKKYNIVFEAKKGPGPGSYRIVRKLNPIGRTIEKAKKKDFFVKNKGFPGPGSYGNLLQF